MGSVRPATIEDVDLLARIGAAGFYDDPVLSWVFRDDARRLAQLTFVFTGMVHDMLPDRGTVHLACDACAAFWRDPDFEHGRTAADRVEEAIDESDVAPSPLSPDELERLSSLGAVMMASHPHEPHWYLNVVSTIPAHQGQGLGTAALQPVLARCDADGTPAYLESSNPRNVSLYRRQGFIESGEIKVPDGPTLIAMWREPRRV